MSGTELQIEAMSLKHTKGHVYSVSETQTVSKKGVIGLRGPCQKAMANDRQPQPSMPQGAPANV